MIKLLDLIEAKQVGTLYHFTWISNLKNILKDNKLGLGDSSTYTRKFLPQPGKYGPVSLTRNKNFSKNIPHTFKNTSVSIALDGDKISNNYKIKPYHWDPSHSWPKNSPEYEKWIKKHGKDAFADQMEETTDTIKNLDKYITKVTIYKNNIYNDPWEDWDDEEFEDAFKDCIRLMKEKNIPYEIK